MEHALAVTAETKHHC